MMLNHLLVLLEKSAVPFCYYDNPYYYSQTQTQLIPLATLQAIISSAQDNPIPVTFVYGRCQLPLEYEELIDGISHTKIIPLALQNVYPDGLVVVEADDQLMDSLKTDKQQNIILRVAPHNIVALSSLFQNLLGKFKRLNIHLVAMDYLTTSQLNTYEDELKTISKILAERYRAGEEIEVNVLSDRLLLSKMNNCNAGQQHITVAPNGKCYICPGFYYQDEGNSLGGFSHLADCGINNSQLLKLANAPLCSRCDAFHCKRCVYLNKKTTMEINIPSAEQCQVSHIERDISRQLLNSFGAQEPFSGMNRILNLTYRDPLYKLTHSLSVAEPATGAYESVTQNEALTEMLELQKKILGILQHK